MIITDSHNQPKAFHQPGKAKKDKEKLGINALVR